MNLRIKDITVIFATKKAANPIKIHSLWLIQKLSQLNYCKDSLIYCHHIVLVSFSFFLIKPFIH